MPSGAEDVGDLGAPEDGGGQAASLFGLVVELEERGDRRYGRSFFV